MTTKKQRRMQVAEKSKKFREAERQIGLAAQKADREAREQKQREKDRQIELEVTGGKNGA